MSGEYFSIKFQDDKVVFLDQTKLPFEEIYVGTDNIQRIAEAIEKLEVRGAPLIGITAAYALALSQKNNDLQYAQINFDKAFERIKRTRPTAVNLFNALNRVKKVF